MVIRGIRKTDYTRYFSKAHELKLQLRRDTDVVIKAISSDVNKFVRKNQDTFVAPTISIDSVKVTRAEEQKIEAMMNDIANASGSDFMQECKNILEEGHKHTRLVKEKMDNMISKIGVKEATKKGKITTVVGDQGEEKELGQEIKKLFDKNLSDNPKEMRLKEKNPLDTIYEGIDDMDAKQAEETKDFSSLEISYV